MNPLTPIMYGADWCPDCRRAKAFLDASSIEYAYHDIEIDEAHTRAVETANGGRRVIPTFRILKSTYANPTNGELACVLGVNDFGRIVLYGADWCPDCRRAKAFLADHHAHYMFVDIDKHEWAAETVESLNQGKRIIPTLVINGKAYSNPANAVLLDVLGLDTAPVEHVYDVVIVGGGAAGLTTAIYAQRERLSSLILERKSVGGNAFLTEKIENYPGFLNISGPDLMDRMAVQAKTYGAEIREGFEVTHITSRDGLFQLHTPTGTFEGKSVVLAVGSTYKQLGIPGEDDLIGAGIHFCATCDGPFYRDRDIIVIGGGNSALEEGLYLTQYAKSVSFVARRPEFTASATYVEKLAAFDNVQAYMNQTSQEFVATDSGGFRGLRIRDNESGATSLIEADGAFVFIGLTPNTGFVADVVDRDERGFLATDPESVKTSIPGVFAAGDCRRGAVAQIAAATGEGVMASYAVKEYLRRMW